MIESGKIIVKNQNNEDIECDVLFTFDNDVTLKSYIVYTDNSLDELGNLKVFANTFDRDNSSGELGEINSQEEWDLIEQIFSSINGEKEVR